MTSSIFAIHEPIIFPSDISALFWRAAPNDIANSGADVPNATIINEIMIEDIPNFAAVLDVPSTRISDPFQRKIIPIINEGIAKTVSIIF